MPGGSRDSNYQQCKQIIEMRTLKILFNTPCEIFFIDESKQLQYYYNDKNGDNLFKEMFGYLEDFENWSSLQLSDMVSNGLYVDDVQLFELWSNRFSLFQINPELYDYVKRSQIFNYLELSSSSDSILAFIQVLEPIVRQDNIKLNNIIFQCYSLAKKLSKKEAKEKADKEATWIEKYEERRNKQNQILEELLDFEFIPRIELQNKKAS